MSLSKDLISQFVKATKDTTTVKKESTVYGTVVKYNEKTYVKIDGSDLLTPAETLSSVEEGERVSIMIKDHTATITGNYTAPSASSIKVDGMDADLKANTADIKNLVAKNAEIENLVASKATIEDLRAANAEIDTLKSNYAEIETLVADKASIGDLEAVNADIKSLKADKADIAHLEANYATIGSLNAVYADVTRLEADKANIKDLEANYATIESLEANYATISQLESNYATIKQLDAANANITNLQTETANINTALIDKANVSDLAAANAVINDLKVGKADIGDLSAANAKIADLEAGKADISVLEANYATIKQLDAANANITSLQTETANINKALIDKADVSDLNATNANITNLQATKANVSDLNATNANINTLTGNLADITTLVNGNLTSDNIQSMVITGDKFTVEDGFIKNAMIDTVNASKINTGILNTNNVSIQSNDGSMVLQGNLQQFKDKNGKVRIQIGKDATGNFTFVLYDENGTGQLINQNGIQSSNAIADGLIVDSKVADNANIAGSKLDIDSVVTEVNNGTTSIKGTKIYLDDQKQSLNVAFNNMSTTVKGNTNTIQSHTTSINAMNGKVTQLISDTTITKQDGTTTSLKDAYNATVDTVDSHSTKIGSLETNLATANNNISSVSSKQTALEQNLNGFKQTVSQTYTTKAEFNNLTIGGTNLVAGTRNFGDGWWYGGFTLQNNVYDGTFKGCYINWTGTSDYRNITKTNAVYLEPNTEYTLSFWAKGTGKFWSYLYRPNTATIASGYNSSGDATTSSDGAITTVLSDASNFKRYWITWKTVSNLTPGKYDIIPCRVAANRGNCEVVICGIKIEKGNKATAWTPAPEDIDASITAVDSKFTNYSTTSQMNSAINQKANEITSTVSETYATKASLTTVDNKFADYSTTSAMNSAINQKANEITSSVSQTYATKTALSTVDNKFADYSTTKAMNSAINQKGDSILSTVSSTYATKTSLKATDDKFANYSTTSQMNSAINQKADSITQSVSNTYATKTALKATDDKFANYSTTTAMNSAINQKGDSILSTVSNTYTTKAEFNDLSIGGTNILPNTKTFKDWGLGGGTLQTNGYNGFTVRYKKYTATSGGGNMVDLHLGDILAIEPNTDYTLSFWIKGTGSFYSYIYPTAIVKVINCDGATWAVSTPGDGGIRNTVTNSNSWRRFWITFTSGANVSGNKNVIVARQCDQLGNSELYICGVKLEKGSKASDWSPAPQDIDSAISVVDGKFANYSTTSQMNSAINQKANEITSTVSETYATKSALTTVDNKFANYSTTSAMNSAINQKSDAILSTVSNTYATKTALSTVDGKFANYSTTSQMNSAINQKSDSILSTVSSTYTTKTDFNGLTIGGTNLYPNSNFKTQPQYFEQAGGSRVTWDSSVDEGNVTTKYNGKVVRLFDSQGTSSSPKDVYLTFGQTATLQPNTTYTLSFDYYSAGAFVRSSSYIYLWKTKGDLSTRGLIGLGVTNNSKNRTRFVRTFTTDSEHLIFQFRIGFVDTGACWVAVDGVKLEKGNRATEWSPTPGDIDTSIATVDGKFTNYSTTSQMNSAINQKANEITSTVSETYATKTALNTVDGKFGNYSTTSAMNTAINQKADSILSTVSGTYATKTALSTVDNKFTNYSTTSAMNSAINQKGDSILSTVSSTYATKTALSTVDGKFANYSTTSAMNSAINQKSDAILSTVSNTYTTKSDFNGLTVGGTNLLLKTKTFDIAGGLNKTGEIYRGLVVRGINSIPDTMTYICEYGFTDFNYSDIFTFSFYAKGNLTNLCAYFYGDSGYVPAYLIENSVGVKANGSGDGYSPFGKITSEWKRYWVTWQVAGSGNKSITKRILLRTDGSKVGENIYICGCKFERGNKATEWTPAPEDIDASITTVDNKFANYSTTSQMNSAINQKANEITSTVSETYATKNALTSVDNKFANYSTTTAMNSAINQKGDSILSTVSNTYATKTTVTDLSNNLKNNYSTTTAMNTAINQKSDAILSTVSSTYTTKSDFNKLSIGGTNLLTGTRNFDDGWLYDGFVLQNGQYDGTFKGCYINWTGTSGYKDVGKNNSVYLEPNTEYTLSFWARGNGKFWSYLYAPNKVVIASGYNSSGASTTSPDGAIVNTLTDNDKFKRYWITWKTASNLTPGKYNVIPCRVASNLGNCHMVICGVKIEKGNKATAWTPAPQDVDSAISAVDNKFASYSTTTQMNSAINQKANEITSSVSKTYATKTDLNTANGNISSLTNRMQSAESKLTKDSLTTTIGSYYTTSTDVNGLITNKGYATTSQVTQTASDLTAKFKSTGGINLIRNSTAIGGLNGWQGNIAYSEADSVGKVTGNRRFFYINNKNTTENYAFSPRFALKANTTYTLSCWIYRNTTSTGYDIFVLASTSLPWTDTSTSYNNAYHIHVGSATGWERVEKTFTTGANDISGYVRIDNNGYSGSGDANVANIHFGSLMLTEGTIAHPWTPHPSECYSGITQIDGQGIKVYHKNIDGENYTHMASSGFYIKNKGVDIFKVDANGLYVKGNGDFTGKVTANDGSIGGFTISNGKLVGTGGNGVGMSGNGTDWAFWAGSNTGGNAPFHVGHEGNLYATQAYITGTITGSTINAGTINGATINSDSFIGDMLAIDGTISAKSLQVQDIDSAKYPATLDGNVDLYVNSSSGNDDIEVDDGARFKTLQGAIDAIPKFLNNKTVYITMETDSTEDVSMRGIVGGAIRIYMNGKTLYGTLRSYVCAASINVYGGSKSSTEGATGVVHPSVGISFGGRAVSVGFEASQYAAIYKVKVFAPDSLPSDVTNTDKVCIASQSGTGSVYCKNIQIVNADIGFRANNLGGMHVSSSSGVASKYGFQATTGGIITIANNAQAGGKKSSTNKSGGGQVIYDANGPTFATGNQSTDGGTAPVAPTTKVLTVKSSYGDTYRSSVYNNWKKDGTVRQGDYGYGDCNGCWFFGSAFAEVKGATIKKVTITITRQSGGSSSAVGLVVKSHGHSSRPSGAPTFRTTAGTLSLAPGKSGPLVITNSTILNEIKSGVVKGFGIQATYDKSHYAVCSGSVTVKIEYQE